jgi:SAM-dependent methyltransferase
MNNVGSDPMNLYLTDQYIENNPTVHEEDSPWKIGMITPLVDRLVPLLDGKAEINLLDVGGGAGIILSAVSEHIETKHRLGVRKFALDLSPGMLEMQKRRNPDLHRAVHADVRSAPFEDKEVDLTLMIDVLEHVPCPAAALAEIKRFSRYILFKVPLENSLHYRLSNFIRRGRPRRHDIEVIGHVNSYRWRTLKRELEDQAGQVLSHRFTNVFDYHLRSGRHRQQMKTRTALFNRAAARLFKLSPEFCSLLFTDFVMVLVRCY